MCMEMIDYHLFGMGVIVSRSTGRISDVLLNKLPVGIAERTEPLIFVDHLVDMLSLFY